ncbi:HalOD1 output domain-containing protein [Halorubrum kocurii]|uniref:HalOD1 output domain-containing protein n=1 Tax=Halorubrum kocurii TaxID=478441 RepID=UPI0009B5C575|nr:HalOD1 output domain-containing protein [Halorubrum kocurii]
MRESSEEPLLTIAESVSEALVTPIEELPPLSQSIDLEGLAAIVTEDRSHDVTVTFSYADHRVLVHSNNTVYVCPIQNDNSDRWNVVEFDKSVTHD